MNRVEQFGFGFVHCYRYFFIFGSDSFVDALLANFVFSLVSEVISDMKKSFHELRCLSSVLSRFDRTLRNDRITRLAFVKG